MGECLKMSDVAKRRKSSLPEMFSIPSRCITMKDINLSRHLANLYQPTPDRKLYKKLPPGIWKGRRCFIIGGGPSLRGFNFDKLKGEIVITVNRGFESYPDSVLNLCQDPRVWGWWECGDLGIEAKKKFERYEGYKVWLKAQVFPYPEDIHVIDCCHSGDFNFENYKGGIPPYGNSGLNALCLAVCLRASEIYLLGFDCKGENGKTSNFHAGYPENNTDEVYNSFVKEFNEVAYQIKSKTRVINLNKDSAIRCFEFGSFEEIKKIKRPLYVSYFTKGTGYEIEIQRLHESIRKFGLEYKFVGIEDQGSWRRNIHARIQVLKNLLDDTNRDIVYIDADGALIHYPEAFDGFKEDFGAVWLDREKYFPNNWKTFAYGSEKPGGKWEILGGTMYFKNNKRARAMLDVWEKLDAPMDTVLSQVHLPNAIKNVEGLKIKKLEDGYCQIFDIMAAAGEPIIEHYQASRRSIGAVKITEAGFELDLKEKSK